MRKTFDEEETKAKLLVDALNAFNNLNRATALHTIKYSIASYKQLLQDSYKADSQ
jgi:hypothetical protein